MVRIKERYLLVNIIYQPDVAQASKVPSCVTLHQPTTERLTPQSLIKGIKAEVAVLFGDYGAGAFEGNLSVKYLSLATSTFILRCPRAHYQMLWSALTCMNRVPANDGRPCIFRVVRVSGTIRKAEEEAIRQAKNLILLAKEQTSAEATQMGYLANLQQQQQQDPMLGLTGDSDSDNSDDDMDEGDG